MSSTTSSRLSRFSRSFLMPTAYHIHKRQDCIRLLEQLGDTNTVAQLLDIHPRTARKWRAPLESTGSLDNRYYRCGRTRSLSALEHARIIELVEERRDVYLFELVEKLLEENINTSISTAWRELDRAEYTRKLLHKLAAERNKEDREDFVETVRRYVDPAKVFYIDEMGKEDDNLYRRWGWGPRGEPAVLTESWARSAKSTLVGALGLDGMKAVKVVPGALNSSSFYDFLMEDLLPFIPSDSVLIADNCRIHHHTMIRPAVESFGCALLFLPPYSPDMNAIEGAFALMRKYMKKHHNTYTGMAGAEIFLDVGMWVGQRAARGLVRYCGWNL